MEKSISETFPAVIVTAKLLGYEVIKWPFALRFIKERRVYRLGVDEGSYKVSIMTKDQMGHEEIWGFDVVEEAEKKMLELL